MDDGRDQLCSVLWRLVGCRVDDGRDQLCSVLWRLVGCRVDDGRDQLDARLLTRVGARGEFDHRVERDGHERGLVARQTHQIPTPQAPAGPRRRSTCLPVRGKVVG